MAGRNHGRSASNQCACGGTSGERTATGEAVIGFGFRRNQRNRQLSGPGQCIVPHPSRGAAVALAEQRTLGQETGGKRAWGGLAVATLATEPVGVSPALVLAQAVPK